MPIHLTNTLTGRKEEFRPLAPPQVTMYVCGVTVYDDCHIGHARGAVVFDVLRRFLESDRCKFQVKHVRNITDVDDKIIDRARREPEATGDLKARVASVSRRYTERFQSDFRRLGLLPPDEEPKATEFIPKMIRFIEHLIRGGVAYPGSDGVYFAVRELAKRRGKYGDLSHQNLDQMMEGARAEAGEGKKDPLDFALWKKAKPEEPAWDSPWGPGRPGWHIECSTMSTDLLGDQFDIHGGGQDLIFPHHENELAQALGAGKPFARYWLHNGLLTVNGQKMSKSLGNFVTIEEALKRHPADVLRLFFLSAHYRSPQDFTWEHLDEAAHAYDRLVTFLTRADFPEGQVPIPDFPSTNILSAEEAFWEAMEDDLNTPRALGSLYHLVASINSEYLSGRNDHAEIICQSVLRRARAGILELGSILGFFQSTVEIKPEIRNLIKERDAARQQKDFVTSDRIRTQLMEMGYIVEDTADKTVVRKRV